MKLYGYFRSSAAYRVRIALNLKGLDYEHVSVHLLKDGGQQFSESYKSLNPTSLIPTLVDGELAIGQSMAILEYLEETHPKPALLPSDAAGRARVRAIAQTIACDIHPLNNLRVLKHLKNGMGLDEETKNDWYRHWIDVGLNSLEAMLANSPATGRYCHGDEVTLADVVLVPQVFNARRFNCDLSTMPTVTRIADTCSELDAFILAEPARQPDAEA
ncbi:MAG TPA: maleylacetoacetate isomerase [Burkholderiaceae bacterium]|nr:maleylacetoacetate isomerase [Burkholderiaceae bacterium]